MKKFAYVKGVLLHCGKMWSFFTFLNILFASHFKICALLSVLIPLTLW